MKCAIALVFIACTAAVFASQEKSKREGDTDFGVQQCKENYPQILKLAGINKGNEEDMCKQYVMCTTKLIRNRDVVPSLSADDSEFAKSILKIINIGQCLNMLNHAFIVNDCDDELDSDCDNDKGICQVPFSNTLYQQCRSCGYCGECGEGLDSLCANEDGICKVSTSSTLYQRCRSCGFCAMNFGESCVGSDLVVCAGNLVCDKNSNKCACASSSIYTGNNSCVERKKYGESCASVQCAGNLTCDSKSKKCTCNWPYYHNGKDICIHTKNFGEKCEPNHVGVCAGEDLHCASDKCTCVNSLASHTGNNVCVEQWTDLRDEILAVIWEEDIDDENIKKKTKTLLKEFTEKYGRNEEAELAAINGAKNAAPWALRFTIQAAYDELFPSE